MTIRSKGVLYMVAGLAGLLGQVTAFGASTNAAYDVTAIQLLSAGRAKIVQTNSATAVFLSDGTFSLTISSNDVTGSYTAKGSSVKLILDANGTTALESNAIELAQSLVPTNVVITASSAKISALKLTKAGAPVSTKDSVKGKGSETLTVKGKTKTVSKSFTVGTVWTDWVLTAGANF